MSIEHQTDNENKFRYNVDPIIIIGSICNLICTSDAQFKYCDKMYMIVHIIIHSTMSGLLDIDIANVIHLVKVNSTEIIMLTINAYVQSSNQKHRVPNETSMMTECTMH